MLVKYPAIFHSDACNKYYIWREREGEGERGDIRERNGVILEKPSLVH